MHADASFLAKVASGLLWYSIGSTGWNYSLSELSTEAFYDRDSMIAACERHREAAGLSADESGRINALRIGLAAATSRNLAAAPQMTEPVGAGEIQVAQPPDDSSDAGHDGNNAR